MRTANMPDVDKTTAQTPQANVPEWVASRRKNNLILGLALGGFVLAIFLLAIWKYRPV